MPQNALAPMSANSLQLMVGATPNMAPSAITRLSSAEEKQFQSWIRSTDWFKEFFNEYKEEPDLNTTDYDYRAAWKGGIKPERDPHDKNRYHWPSSLPDGSMLKSEQHPTAWKEYFMRQTGKNPDALGLTNQQDADAYLRMAPAVR